MALIELTDLEKYVVIPATEVEKYQQVIDTASAVVKSYLKFDPELSTYDYTYNITETKNRINLRSYPVTALYELKLNGADYADSYSFDNEIGVLALGEWLGNGDVFKIRYQAGYAVLPDDIKDATCKLCAWEIGRRNSGNYGVRTQAQGEAVTSYEIDIPVNIKNQLKEYVRNNLMADAVSVNIALSVET
jgi:hypothetical protein